MARPTKEGLDYFPLDVDFFSDEKIEAITGEFGIKGEITVIKLLCAIYRNGYFIVWSDMLKMKLLRNLPGISKELLEQIVSRLVKWNFFDEGLFNSDNILTSSGIQKRFLEATKRRKEVENSQFWLLKRVNVDINPPTTVVNVDINTQRKVKESKLNNYNYPFVKIKDFADLYKSFDLNKLYLLLAYRYWQLWREEHPNDKTLKDATVSKWYDSIRLIIEVDGQNTERLIAVLKYFEMCQKNISGYDRFWFDTIKTTASLRKKSKDGVYYLDQIAGKVNQKLDSDSKFNSIVSSAVKNFEKQKQ